MKFPRQWFLSSWSSRCFFLLAAGAMLPLCGHAQPKKAVTPAERKQSFDDASTLFKHKDYARAEEALLRANRNPADTLAGQLESATKLTHMALSLRQQYDHKGAAVLAWRTLVVLEEAEKSARKAEPRQQARVQEMIGFVWDELLRDAAAARSAYEKALLANPSSARARQELDRLEEEKNKEQRLKGKR